MDEFKQMYLQLVDDLNKFSKAYHLEHKSLIPDTEYDLLYKQLVEMEHQHPSIIVPHSPSQRVGERPDGSFEKKKHPYKMYSLENVFNVDELKKFYKRFSGLRNQFSTNEVDQYYCDCKMDGLSLDLLYNEGKLALAITRGDGVEGDDVTSNAIVIPNIPKTIQTKMTVCVRGEVVVHKADFYAINRSRYEKKLSTFSNTRNYASGSLKLRDSKQVKERALRFYAWEVIVPSLGQLDQETQIAKATELGFNTPKGRLCQGLQDVISFVNEIAKIRNDLPYDIDGVVIKQNQYTYKKVIGWNNHAPLWATAWKFTSDGADTEITQINWSMGRTGKLTPVAHIKPVNINGVVISQVTLNNAAYIEKNSIGPGAKVKVIRSGDVIPKFSEFISKGTYLGVPDKCPYCGKELIKSSTGTDVICTNHECKETLICILDYMLGKEVINMKGYGESFIRELVESGTVTKFTDVFIPLTNKSKKLKQDDLDLVVKRIQDINLMELLMSLGINGMGRAIASKITAEVITIPGLIETLESEELFKLLPVNDGVKNSLMSWYNQECNKEILNTLISYKLTYCS